MKNYRVSVIDTTEDAHVIDDVSMTSLSVAGMLRSYTDLTRVGRLEFMQRLYSDGIAQHVGACEDGLIFDVTAIEDNA